VPQLEVSTPLPRAGGRVVLGICSGPHCQGIPWRDVYEQAQSY